MLQHRYETIVELGGIFVIDAILGFHHCLLNAIGLYFLDELRLYNASIVYLVRGLVQVGHMLIDNAVELTREYLVHMLGTLLYKVYRVLDGDRLDILELYFVRQSHLFEYFLELGLDLVLCVDGLDELRIQGVYVLAD